MAKECNVSYDRVFASVTVVVSLGAKLAQAEGTVRLHIDLPLLHSCTFVYLVTEPLRAHMITPPTHSRWFKVATKSELHLSWWRSAVPRHRKWSHLDALEIRGNSSSRTVARRYGHHGRLDDVAAADKTADGRLFAASP